MGKKLKIKLLANGKVEMTTEGIKGKKCLDYIEFLKEIADVSIDKTEYTSEYYEPSNELEQEQETQQNLI